MPTPRLTRRRLLTATGTGALAATAGCAGLVGEDSATVTLMIERVSIGSSEDGHSHDEESSGLSADALAHTCSHVENLEAVSLEASDSQDGAASANAHEPYSVTLSDDSGYVAFEPRASAQFGFFLAGGSLSVATGSAVYEADDVADCDAIDRYTVVEPEGERIVVELSASG